MSVSAWCFGERCRAAASTRSRLAWWSGLAAPAYAPTRDDLRQATGLVRRFREEPTPELARSAQVGLVSALSPNARLQAFYHPWTSYVIVPLFALANAGLVLDPGFLADAYTSAITLGIIVAYVVGKPVAVVGSSWAVTRLSRGRIRPPIGNAAVLASGTIAGIGFTVALLIASRAFIGDDLDKAKLGGAVGRRPLRRRDVDRLATHGAVPGAAADTPATRRQHTDPGPHPSCRPRPRPHPRTAPVGDHRHRVRRLRASDGGQAETSVRELLTDTEIRYVWRHLPLVDVHPQAQLAAQATEAASAQGAFWPMHDRLLQYQDALSFDDLIEHAAALGCGGPAPSVHRVVC